MRALLLLLAGGCTSPPADPPPAASPTCADGELLDAAGLCVPRACGAGPYAEIEAIDLYVDPAAPEAGDGSLQAPFHRLKDALDQIDERGGGTVALAAGNVEGGVQLGSAHDGLSLVGRCSALSRLVADPEDPDSIALLVEGNLMGTTAISLAGLGLEGSRFAGLLVSGAIVDATDIQMEEVEGIGVYLLDRGTSVRLDGVEVDGVLPREDWDGLGGGLFVTQGAQAEVLRSRFADLSGVGIFVEQADAILREVSVEGVAWASADNWFGAGVVAFDGSVHASGLSVQDAQVGLLAAGPEGLAIVSNGSIRASGQDTVGTTGPGVEVLDGGMVVLSGVEVWDSFALGIQVLGEGSRLEAEDCLVSGVSLGFDPEGTGFGLNLTQGATAELRRCTFEDFDRQGIQIGNQGAARLEEVEILPTSGTITAGLQVVEGGILESEGLRIEGAYGAAVLLWSGSTATMSDTALLGSWVLPEDDGGAALAVGEGAVATLDGLTIEGASLHGLWVSGEGSSVSVQAAEISGVVESGGGSSGRCVAVQLGAQATFEQLSLSDCQGMGLFAASADTAVRARDLVVEELPRPAHATYARGVHVQDLASVELDGARIAGVAGPGLYVIRGLLDASEVEVAGVSYAGLAIEDGQVRLTRSTLGAVAEDASEGGGVGFVIESTGWGGLAPSLQLEEVEIAAQPYAAGWIQGEALVDIQGGSFSGGAGKEISPTLRLHGDALVAREIGAWSEAEGTGLRLRQLALVDSAGVGLFLEAAGATMEGLSFEGNAVDLWQQDCEGLPEVDLGELPEGISTSLCAQQLRPSVALSVPSLHLDEVDLEP